MTLPDMQQSKDGFKKIPIQKVGMRNVEIPLKIFHTGSEKMIEVKGTFSSYCNLVEDLKGINMSRISRTLIDILSKERTEEDSNIFLMMKEVAYKLQEAHKTDDIYAKVTFDYPLYIASPFTNLNSPEYAQVAIETRLKGEEFHQLAKISRVGMSLCPCSKEMSLLTNNLTEDESNELESLSPDLLEKVKKAGFGAHNQRSHIDATMEVIDPKAFILERIFDKIDRAYSCPTKTVLKRPDEKVLTEVSYMGGYYEITEEGVEFQKVSGTGPKFVEDIARDVASNLNEILDLVISDYVIVVNNNESIHSGDIQATAILTAGRNLV